jgi:hypothetical protein
MDLMQLVSFVCFYGPTPLAGILAGWQAMQCKSPWQAFFVGMIGTIALAVVFGIAADYVPTTGLSPAVGAVWKMHLMISPLVGIPLGIYCAYHAHQRESPPDQVT